MFAGFLTHGLRSGVMLFSMGWVYRESEPFLFWLSAAVFVVGIIAMTVAAIVI
jgi:hypothetical protein